MDILSTTKSAPLAAVRKMPGLLAVTALEMQENKPSVEIRLHKVLTWKLSTYSMWVMWITLVGMLWICNKINTIVIYGIAFYGNKGEGNWYNRNTKRQTCPDRRSRHPRVRTAQFAFLIDKIYRGVWEVCQNKTHCQFYR